MIQSPVRRRTTSRPLAAAALAALALLRPSPRASAGPDDAPPPSGPLVEAPRPVVPAPGARAPLDPSPVRAAPGAPTPLDRTPSEAFLRRIDLRDVSLDAACRILSDQTGLNIVPSATAGVTRVSLFLSDVSATTAIEALCEAHSLWYRRDPRSGLIRIHTQSEYRRDLLSVRDETTEVFTLLYPNAAEIGYAIRNLYGDRVVLRFGSGDQDTIEDLENRLDRFDVMDERTQGFGVGVNGQSNGLNGTGSGAGFGSSFVGVDGTTVSGGGGNGRSQRQQRIRPRRDSLLDEDGTTRTTAAAEREHARLDVSAQEMSDIERLLGGTRPNDAERAALLEALERRAQSPIRVTVVRRQNRVIVRTGDESALGQIRTLVRRLDVPTAMVLLEVRILSIDLGDGFSSFFEYQSRAGSTGGSFSTGSIAPAAGSGLGVGGTGLRTGDFTFQFVNDEFAARLQLLESRSRVRSIATPLLLTANNEVSRLFVGREVPLNRSFVAGQAITNDTTTTTVPGSTGIEFRPVGTTLLITPSINSDRTVTLRIVQETSDVNTTSTVLVPTGLGFTPQELNVVSSQSVSGTIVAKNQLAVAFGGLIETVVQKENDQVPVLGDVPVLGFLFRRVVDATRRREIVIVVRPYVMSTPSESEAISRGLLRRLGVDTCEADVDVSCTPECKEPPRTRAPRYPFRLHGVDGCAR